VIIDVGTGDGRAVIAAASRDPGALVVGMDASAAAMIESSRRAARPARKGGFPNAAFVLAAAEAPPAELAATATLVTVQFPWGSLLRGCLGADQRVARGITALLAPCGALELLLAPAQRDGLDDLPTDPRGVIEAAESAFVAHGLCPVEARPATYDEIRASASTWARRLGTDRRAALIRLARR
jgi:16S rRNA (adenine(1408)-N(1))-methyltransferase